MIRKVLLSLASLFLIWQSYGILAHIQAFESSSWTFNIFLSWIINLFITGVFAFAGFAFPTQKALPTTYYHIYQPKRLKKIYKAINVELFRKLLLATLWKSKNQREKYFNGKKEGIANLEEQSMKSEFGHLLPFVLIFILCIYFVIIGLIKLAVFTFLINIIGNLYPIILQRYHRMRIQILKRRYQ